MTTKILPGDLFFEGVFFPFLFSFRVGVLLLDRILLLQLTLPDTDNFCIDWLQALKFIFDMFLEVLLNDGLMFSLFEDFFTHRWSGPRVMGPSIVAKLFNSLR